MDPKIMLLFAIFAAVAGQVLMKSGLNQVGSISGINVSAFFKMILNPLVFSGIASYGIGFIAYLFALTELPQSFAYPMFALGYAIIPIFNWVVMHEPFSITRLVGIVVILVGVWLASR